MENGLTQYRSFIKETAPEGSFASIIGGNKLGENLRHHGVSPQKEPHTKTTEFHKAHKGASSHES